MSMHQELERRSDESLLQHHRRLVYGKLVDKTLSDVDYTELAPYVYGQEICADTTRRMMYGSRETLKLLDVMEAREESETESTDDRRVELQKAQQRFYDQRRAYNQIVRERARQEELNDIVERAIAEHAHPFQYEGRTCRAAVSSGNDLMVTLADIHYGIDVKNAWNTYNPEVCEQMLDAYADAVINISETHGSENCYVLGLGDFISGNCHLPIALANRENVVGQIMGVSELMSHFVYKLSGHFGAVYFISVAGNHSRIGKKDNAPTDERLDDLIPFYMKARLQNIENVFIGDEAGEKLDATISCVNVRGKEYALVHGDYDGTPVKMPTLQIMAGRPLYGVICGHKHHSYSEFIDGVRLVMAGSFVAMDDYAISKRLFSKPEQTVCVCDRNGILCTYNVPLTHR